jgi:type II secretory pathway predicted ATPase ExeA
MKRDGSAWGANESGSTRVLDIGMSGDDLGRFGLQSNPFEGKHDPRFLLRSGPLRRVLESLRVMMDAGNNLTVVVGESGIGKSAAMDAMSREFKDGIRTAYIADPTRSWSEIGQEIGEKLRLSGGRLSPRAMIADRGVVQTFRVIVDRAELLELDSIKHLGAYLDMKVGGEQRLHRLQIVLVAREIEDAPVFRWLARRAHSRVEFARLAASEIREYVARRVRIAQAVAAPIFTADALVRIAEAAGGNPRAINLLCTAAFNLAASRGNAVVDAEMIGTAVSRVRGTPSPASVTPKAPARARPKGEPKLPAASSNELLDEPPVSARVETPERRTERSHAGWAIACAALLGVIAGGIGFLYFNPPPPAVPPRVQIVEVELEKIVEVTVEVPVEVVKIVRVEVPVKPRPRAPKPRPRKIAKLEKVVPPPAKPAPAPLIAPKKPRSEPSPSPATVLDRAFAKSQPGDHTRLVEILRHGAGGAKLTQTLKLARIKRKTRTLTIGVLTGDVSNNPRDDARDFALVEIHFFKGLGLRPYRIIQYPKSDMKAFGEALVPMRVISRNFQTNQIDEARVVKVSLEKALDPKLFTLTRMQDVEVTIPNL